MNNIELWMSLDMGLIYGIVAIGIYLTFRLIDFPDLTCDGSLALGAVVSGVMIQQGYHPIICVCGAALAGMSAGCVTGFLHTNLKISQILSGILVAFMLYSVNLNITGGIPNIAIVDEITLFSKGNVTSILIIVTIVVAVSLIYFMNTDFGLGLRSIGHNKKLASLNGICINKMTILGLGLSNGLIALGGGLLNQYQGFADVSSGTGTLIMGLAAVIIGEKVMPTRSVSWLIMACVIGSIIYRLFISLALHGDALNIDTQNLNLITGLLIIAIMVVRGKQRA